MPIKKTPKPKPQYSRKAPNPGAASEVAAVQTADAGLPHAKPLEIRHFELRDDGTIQDVAQVSKPAVSPISKSADPPNAREHKDSLTSDECKTHAKIQSASSQAVPSPGGEGQGEGESHESLKRLEVAALPVPQLIFSHESPFLRLYHGNCFQLLDAIAAKYPEGRFDAIFADPPYFLSNGGITCHAGKMVKVHKGDWDKSRGPQLNHEFNHEWLARCQRVLKPNGTIWVSGTHHVIFSIGYAMQQLGFKILNDIAWEKPNPPPNLSCRYFTHSTETILWAARDEKSKHVFNYSGMKAVTGKQMKTVWQFYPPHRTEKVHGKHPTQKPIALIERCLLASTNLGDLVLDPFMGGGTTAIAAIKLNRGCVGIEADLIHIALATKRADHEIVSIWLRHFRVSVEILVGTALFASGAATAVTARTAGGIQQIDLDLFRNSINGSCVDEQPQTQSQMPTECIFHETKFVFLSCAEVERGSVVHTTVDVSLQEAWAKTPKGKKRETTHIVRCETEILRLK